ncbi:MAG: hypothetical protein NVSMB51_10790 [Solirubrobacteraceae bacterium]
MATSTQDWIEELKGISVLELAELDRHTADQRVQGAHETADGRGDKTDELAVKHVARREPGDRTDVLRRQRSTVHDAALKRQQLRDTRLVGDRLRGSGRVAAHEGQRSRAGEQHLEILSAHAIGGALGEGVLDDGEARVSLAQLGAQLGDLGDGDAAIVDREDGA